MGSKQNNLNGKELFSALCSGNDEKIKLLINSSRKIPIANNKYKSTFLQNAIHDLRFDVAKAILHNEYTYIDSKNKFRNRYVYIPTNSSDCELIVGLIRLGYCITTTSIEHPKNPLHYSIYYPPEVAQWFIEHGVDVNAQDSTGNTPLHIAVRTNNLEAVSMLLYYNADTEIENIERLTPFILSLLYPHNAIQEMLVKFVKFDHLSGEEKRALNLALLVTNPSASYAAIRFDKLDLLTLSFYYQNMWLFQTLLPFFDMQLLLEPNGRSRSHSFLFAFLNDCNFSTSEWLECFYLLMNSKFASDLVFEATRLKDPYDGSLFTYLVNQFQRRSVQKDDRVAIINLLLNAGPKVYLGEVLCVYETYGYEEEFELFLYHLIYYDISHMFYVKNVIGELALNLRLFATGQVNTKLKAYCKDAVSHYRNKDNILLPASFFTLYNHFMQLYDGNLPKELMNAIKDMPKVSSLVELSRNKTIEAIILKHPGRDSAFYQKYIKQLHIPVILKEVLQLRRPIYKKYFLKLPMEFFPLIIIENLPFFQFARIGF